MSPRTLTRLCVLPAATAAIALSLVAPASAHVSATPSSAAAGASTVVTFSVPHGCEGSPTTKIEIQVPESVLSVTADPQPVLRRRERPSSSSTSRRPTPTATRSPSARLDRLHRQHPPARRAARHLRAVLPGAGRRGRDARVPDDPDLREGRDRLDRGPGRGPGPTTSSRARHRPSRSCPRAEEGDHHGDEAEESAEQTGAESDGHRRRRGARTPTTTDSSAALGWAGLGAGLLGLLAGGTRPGPDALDLVTSPARPAWWSPGRPRGGAWSPPRWSRSRSCWGAAAPASAHAELVETDPAEGAVVETAPETVTLTFNEAVRLTSQEIAVYDAQGERGRVDRGRHRRGGHRRPHRGRRPARRDLRRVLERPLRRRPPDRRRPHVLGGRAERDGGRDRPSRRRRPRS